MKKVQKIDVETGEESIGLVQANELASGVADANYIHYQIAASSQWNINHNLGKHPAIVVIDTAHSVVYCNIEYIDLNNAVLTFNYEFSGTAICN